MSYRFGRLVWHCALVPLGMLALVAAAATLVIVWFCAAIIEAVYGRRNIWH